MVTRLYFCKDCGYEYEVVQPMMEELHKICPKCNGSLFQDLTGVHTSIKSYNTVGSLAEKNTRELGHYGREEKERQLAQENKQFSEERKRQLANQGIKLFETDAKKAFEIGQAPPKVIQKMESGDKKAIEKYVYTGEI